MWNSQLKVIIGKVFKLTVFTVLSITLYHLDTGSGWADIGPQLQADLKHTRFIFPTAPLRPITLNFGMRMTGWWVGL